MKKIMIVVGGLIALAAVCMPWINGMLMERGYRELVDRVNTMQQEQGTDLKVEIVRYARSYSTSEVEWKILLGPYSEVYGTDEVVLVDRGRHGLKSVTFTSSLEKNPWYGEFVAGQPSATDPVSIVTEYDLLGDIRSRISLAPMQFSADGEQVDVKGASLEFSSDWLLENFTSSGTWDGLAIGEKMTVEGVSFNSDMRLISSFIWDGGATLHIGRITGREDGVELSLYGVRTGYSEKYDPLKKNLDIEISYGVGRFSDGSEEVTNAGVTLGLRGVDAAAYEEMVKTSTELIGEALSDVQAAGDDPEAILRAMEQRMTSVGLQMAGVMEKFLKTGFEIFVSDLHAGMTQGEISGEALLRLEKDLTMAQMFPMVQQPELIFEYLSFRSDLRLPASLLGANPMLLEPVHPGMQTGVFVRQGAEMVSRVETREKKLYINNEEFRFN